MTIKGTAPKADSAEEETIKPAESKKPAETSKKAVTYMDYQVKPKETLYSLSRTFHLSQDELTALNPSLSEGVKEGMVLKVPTGYLAPVAIVAAQVPAETSTTKPVESTGGGIRIIDKVKSTENENVEIVELTKKRGVNERKKVVLLLFLLQLF